MSEYTVEPLAKEKLEDQQFYRVTWTETIQHEIVVSEADLERMKQDRQNEIDAVTSKKTAEIAEFDTMLTEVVKAKPLELK